MSSLQARPDSAARGWTDGIAWLWDLGDVLDEPADGAIGIGDVGEAGALAALVAAGSLRAAVVLAGDEGPASGSVPARRRLDGVARFDGGTRVAGPLTVIDGDGSFMSSSLGAHASLSERILVLAIDPDRDWGGINTFWAYEALGRFLEEECGIRPRRLPGIGALRIDDMPGMALHQLQGTARPDGKRSRALRRHAARAGRAGAVINMAVVAEALEGEERVPLERVWPRSVAVIRERIAAAEMEPICHGLLHLDAEMFGRGEVEFREFARLGAGEAGEAIDAALAWQERNLARPTTFVAPAWAYGPEGDAEAAKRGLIRWHRPVPGPLLEDGRVRETLIGALPGIHGVDLSPLQRLAAAGIPPTVTMHGALLDSRMQSLSPRRNPLTLARLFVRRDLPRLLALEGIEWLGAADFAARLGAHGLASGRVVA